MLRVWIMHRLAIAMRSDPTNPDDLKAVARRWWHSCVVAASGIALTSGCVEVDEPQIDTTSAALTAPAPCSGCWLPSVGARWQYQLQGSTSFPSTGGIDVNIAVVPAAGGAPVAPEVFDIDLYESDVIHGRNDVLNSAAVAAIHARGARAICYVSAGSFENSTPPDGPLVMGDGQGSRHDFEPGLT